jgi:uncharacterized protein YjbI with pentapeptide repeats
MPRIHFYVLISISLIFGSSVVADTPGDPYTVDLGRGNEDLEEEINAVPWTQAHFYSGVRVKDLSGIKFQGRDLRGSRVRLLGYGLMNANFDGCQFDGSSFDDVAFFNCSFKNARMRYCKFTGLSGWHNVTNDLSNADITGSWMWNITKSQLVQTMNFQNRTLVETSLGGDFSGIDLSNFHLTGCAFRNALTDVPLSNATLVHMNIPKGVSFKDFRSTKNFQSKDLSQLHFTGRDEGVDSEWDFSNCLLGYFSFCNLRSVAFADAIFLPKITGPRLGTSSLSICGFDSCQITEHQLKAASNWQRRDIRSLHLRNMDLSGWDFSAFRMGGADLKGSNVKGTKFTGAMLRDPGWGMSLDLTVFDDCQGLTVAQLMESKTFAQKTRQSVLETYGLRVAFDDLTDEEKRYLDYWRKTAALTRVKAILRE